MPREPKYPGEPGVVVVPEKDFLARQKVVGGDHSQRHQAWCRINLAILEPLGDKGPFRGLNGGFLRGGQYIVRLENRARFFLIFRGELDSRAENSSRFINIEPDVFQRGEQASL